MTETKKPRFGARLAVIANLEASSLSRPTRAEQKTASQREDQRFHGGEVLGLPALDVNAQRVRC
jgi:hypothetical protein